MRVRVSVPVLRSVKSVGRLYSAVWTRWPGVDVPQQQGGRSAAFCHTHYCLPLCTS